jgi:uncharacterized protein (DUF1800 family)
MPLTPYTGPFGTPELRHLLRRSLFGCSLSDLAHFNGLPLDQVVSELLTFTNNTTPPLKTYWLPNGGTPDPALLDPDVPFGASWVDTPRAQGLNPDPSFARRQSLAAWHAGLMVHQERNLREKLVLFWHNLLVTQVTVVQMGETYYRYLQLLRNNATGNYRQLMYAISTDPAMLIYLNGYLNIAGSPDENYARELLELFTLGEGTGYTEPDVQAAARVLTGWSIQFQSGGEPIIPQTIFLPFLHDSTDKQFSAFFNNTVVQGATGPNAGQVELDALLDMIFTKEEVGLHVCRELYRFFVHGDISPQAETDVIVPLAQIFRDNAGAPDQMRTVMEALLTSEHFFSAEIRACMVKSPADFVVGTLRELQMPMPADTMPEAQYRVWGEVYSLMAYCGQAIGEPPSVAGWPAYHQAPQFDEMWMDSASFAIRKQVYEYFTAVGFSTPADLYDPASAGLTFKVDLVALVLQFSDPDDPNNVVAGAADLLFAVDVSQAVKDQLKTGYLLLGQMNDIYWTNAFQTYVGDPNTPDPVAQLVPLLLGAMFIDMQGAAEHQLT